MKPLFSNKQIRSFFDNVNQKYWFSAIDICKLLTGNHHFKAKNYWHTLKNRTAPLKLENGYKNPKLTLLCKDGSFRQTDVVDLETIILVIKHMPHINCKAYKLYLQFCGIKKLAQRLNHIGRKEDAYTRKYSKSKNKRVVLSFDRLHIFGIGINQKPNLRLVS